MGTWGDGSFENDAASDWCDSFEGGRRSIARLARELKLFQKSQENGAELLAAAEVVAALRGHPSDDLDPDIDQWADKKRRDGAPEIENLSTDYFNVLNQELLGLTEDASVGQRLREIIERLKRPALSAGAKRPRQAPLFELVSNEQEYRFRLVDTGSLDTALKKVGNRAKLVLNFTQEITQQEFLMLSGWLSSHPELPLRLTDYPSKRGYKYPGGILETFSGSQELLLNSSHIKTLDELRSFHQLRKLTLSNCSPKALFKTLSQLPVLTELELHHVSGTSIAHDFGELSAFPRLRRLKIFYLDKHLARDPRTGALPLQITTSRLPELPATLESLSLCSLAAEDLSSLERSTAIKELAAVVVDTRTQELDLRGLTGLEELEFSEVTGLNLLQLPHSMRILGVDEVSNLEVTFQQFPSQLEILWGERAALPHPLPVSAQSEKLRWVWLRKCASAQVVQELELAPNLEGLQLELSGVLDIPNISRLRNLRCLSISCDAIPAGSDFTEIARHPGLREFELRCTEPSKNNLDRSCFDCFREHPTLASLRVDEWIEELNGLAGSLGLSRDRCHMDELIKELTGDNRECA